MEMAIEKTITNNTNNTNNTHDIDNLFVDSCFQGDLNQVEATVSLAKSKNIPISTSALYEGLQNVYEFWNEGGYKALVTYVEELCSMRRQAEATLFNDTSKLYWRHTYKAKRPATNLHITLNTNRKRD